MKSKKRALSAVSMFAVSLLSFIALGVLISGQEAPTQNRGVADDWSHHHLVFSNPGTAAEAMKNGTLEQWYRITNDPRYQLQVLKRSPAQRAVAAAPDFASRAAIVEASDENAEAVSAVPTKKVPVKKDWSEGMGAAARATYTSFTVATPASGNISGSSTLTVDGVTFDASPPVAEVATISVPSSTYCIPPNAGFTVGTTPTNVITNGTAPSGGSLNVTSDSGLAGLSITVGGVTYTYESSLGNTNCGTTLNCLIEAGSGNDHEVSAEALYRAVNNGGNCTDDGWSGACYALATGQGANAAATASHTASTTITSISAWKCAGTVASLWTATGCTNETCTSPTGGGAGSGAANIIMPAPMSNTSLATAINTAITGSTAAGFTHGVSSSTITLTASAAGSTGISDALDGAVTGVNVAVTTAASNGTTSGSGQTFAYWSGNNYVSNSTLASTIAGVISGASANATTNAALTAASNGNTSNNLSLTANNAGTEGNNIQVTAAAFSGFTPTGPTPLAGGISATVQPNAFPATYLTSSTQASCTDFAVYPTGQLGGSGAANIIAYTNLYVGACTGAPTVNWAYNTGTGYSATTSPITSWDGSEIAFVQSTGSSAELVVLKWKASTTETLTSPGAPTLATNIVTCTAPCMTVTALSHNDTYSAPFYDFQADDALYVGDDSGNLEKFTGVFGGSAVTGPTTVSLNATPYPIASPVYDVTSGCVFVGDTYGYLYRVSSGRAGTVCTGTTYALTATSAVLSSSGVNEGIFDAPLVDSTAHMVYAFVTDSKAISPCVAGGNCVAEFPTNFGATAAPSYVEPLGTGGQGYNIYAGTFDNVYYSSATPTGSLYAVANTGTAGGGTLYRVTITSGAITGVTSAATGLNSAEYPWPSPLTEFCNPGTGHSACVASSTQTTTGTDYLFFSVNRGAVGGCTSTAGNGCILSYNISNPTTTLPTPVGLNVTAPGTTTNPAGCWATGGIVIDSGYTNIAGNSQIYFVNLDGALAGGPVSVASANCAGSTSAPTIDAVQAGQASP